MTLLSPNSLSEDDQRTYLLAKTYEEVRQQYQAGYRAFPSLTQDILTSPLWKTFRTVTLWLEERGWDITTIRVHWTGYVRFCFEYLKPTLPMVGQLRNNKLLRDYLHAHPIVTPKTLNGKTDAELDTLYSKILLPEIARSPYARKRLGLDTPDA